MSVCGKFCIPFVIGRKALLDAIMALPVDLGPEAVGLSRDLVKQRKAQESVDVSRLCCLFALQFITAFVCSCCGN